MDQSRVNFDLDRIALVDEDVRVNLASYGYPAPRIRPQGFETLLSTIVGQQISTDAAAAIMARIRLILPVINAAAVLNLPGGALREAGLSGRKVEYAEGLAHAMQDGKIDIESLVDLTDEKAIETITKIRGFGIWSAEIYLMFSLQRPDVFPAADLALQVAIQRLKKLEQRPSPKLARELIAHWAPYRSAGSLFLWHFYRGAPT